MTQPPVARQHHTTFESMRQTDSEDNEFWLARQLAKVLEDSQHRHFLPVIANGQTKT